MKALHFAGLFYLMIHKKLSKTKPRRNWAFYCLKN
jgi:hypothetical protein